MTKGRIEVEIAEHLQAEEPPVRWSVAQALAKGDHAERALDMLTEVGVTEIIPWQAARCVVRWQGDRAAKSLARWRGSVREATKQSRRFRLPEVAEPVATRGLIDRVRSADLALVLHEEATEPIGSVRLPEHGEVLIIVGPEGGISPDEHDQLIAAGGVPVSVSDGVLRTSTAGVVALAACLNRPAGRQPTSPGEPAVGEGSR